MERCTLTREMRGRDYEYLWQVLRRCFPMRGAMERLGYDWDGVEKQCRPAVLDAPDDLAFCRAMDEVFKRFDHFAHLMLYNAHMYKTYQHTYQSFAEGAWEGFDPEGFAPWMQAVRQPKSERFYAAFDDGEGAQRDFYWKGEAPAAPEQKPANRREGPTVTCRMLPGQVAYIKVPTLDMLKIADDRPVLFDFYAKHRGCRHLIVDIRGNGGGATDYWARLLVAPTLRAPVTEKSYMLFPIDPLNRAFIDAGLGSAGEFEGELSPIDRLPAFPAFHREYLSQATHFFEGRYTHKPDPEHPFAAEKVWLLTDKKVYSSAEGFAVFCKGYGWATIVGERTGGDGVGITPFHAVLPESGLLIRYSGVNGLNTDGGSNAEYHTAPDIECDPAEALEVCLERIARMEGALC